MLALVLAQGAAAQERARVYIQIEAQPSLSEAETSLRGYASALSDVNGFVLGGGWYGIALGPYEPSEAADLLRGLRQQGRVPGDSYLAGESEYGRQFWPVGAGLGSSSGTSGTSGTSDAEAPVAQSVTQVPVTSAPLGETPALPQVAEAAEAPVAAEADPLFDPETPAEARRSEAGLTGEDRRMLQVALEWSGHYAAAIDGAFGQGTRAAMADWQRENGLEVTGVLTTRQRDMLLGQYNAVLEGMDMTPVRDDRAGIAIDLPMGAVARDRVESPFVIYGSGGVEGAQVLLISEPGDRDTLWGLYEIMQTLEIVPLTGERSRRNDGFVLTGANSRITSHTEVGLQDGQIKGWTLVWPAGDEERRARILGRMQASFERLPGVLDPAQVSDDGQALDLVSGLPVRRPRDVAAGFFVDGQGAVLTSAAAVAGCGRVTLDGGHVARVVQQDDALGVALLRPDAALAPRGVARLRASLPRLRSEVAVAGYPFGGVLSAPTLTFGALAETQGLGGEQRLARLDLSASAGDAGGPVLDAGGAVLGLLMPRGDAARQLPEEVAFATDAEALLAFLRSAGIRGSESAGEGVIAPEDLTDVARAMTVMVGCWD